MKLKKQKFCLASLLDIAFCPGLIHVGTNILLSSLTGIFDKGKINSMRKRCYNKDVTE